MIGKICKAKYLNCNVTTFDFDVYLVVCCKLLAISGERQEPCCCVNQTANLQTTAVATVRQTTALCCTHHVTAATLDTNEYKI